MDHVATSASWPPRQSGFAPVPRLLLIALDGATPEVLFPLADSGRMPNLARLIGSSTVVRTAAASPCCEAAAWGTLHSGCGAETHGLLDNVYLDHRRRRLIAATSPSPHCPMLADLVTAASPEAPAVCLADLRPCASIWRRKPANLEELSAGIDRINAVLRRQLARVRQADQTAPWRLLTLRIDVLDSLQHRLWHSLPIEAGSGGNRLWVAKVGEAFTALDRCLGELLELAQQRNAAVVLGSPYGFGPLREKVAIWELLQRRRLTEPATGAAQIGYQATRLSAKASQWLRRRLRLEKHHAPASRPIDGLLPIDWRRAQAVVLHGEAAALVYLNTPQRFGHGVLLTPRQQDQAAADVGAALRKAQHPVTDERLFDNVYRPAERFGGDPLKRCWPDVVGIPAAGFQARPTPGRNHHLVRPDPALPGGHRSQGLFLIQAPGVAPGRAACGNLVDVAPTTLALLGIEPPASMTGRPLGAICTLVS